MHVRLCLTSLTFVVASAISAQAAVDFATQVQPLLTAKCAGCHGEKKQSGMLRLDTADAIKAFQKEHFLVVGKPDESELFKRVSLPADDKKRMPKGGEPLSADEINLLKTWIAEGAQYTAATPAPAPNPEQAAPAAAAPAAAAPPTPPAPPQLEPVKDIAAAPPEAIAAAEATGALVMPLHAGSPLLSVTYPTGRETVTDETIKTFLPLAAQIVWLDLGRTKVTDAGIATLSQLKNVEQLHLEQTAVTDASLPQLATLTRLTYLNLYGTKVTDATFEQLKPLAFLDKLYLWQTAVNYDAALAFQALRPGREVNLGWDHPGVVKTRLTKELEVVNAQKAESDKRVTDLEAQLTAAKEEQTKATVKQAETQKQLEAINAPK